MLRHELEAQVAPVEVSAAALDRKVIEVARLALLVS